MKKILIITVTVFLMLSAVSCSGEQTQDSPNQTEYNQVQVTETPQVTSETIAEPTPTDVPQQATDAQPSLPDYEVVYEEGFQIFDPFAEVLSDELLQQIGADAFSGTDEEIVQQIFAWQEENMIYVSDPSSQMDVSYQGRWNMFLPGIYPASELVLEHVNSDGKIYGICSDYTLIFCVLANSYGIETRCTTFTKYKFSEVNDWVDPATTRGLAMEEYLSLNEKMQAQGLNLTYDQIDRVAREGYVHARPEAKIDGQWVPFDGAGLAPTGEYLDDANYEALPYYHFYNNIMLYAPVALKNETEVNFDNLAELLSYCPQLEYEGITDDAGNEHRAASFIDMCRGLGLVPMYNDIEKIAGFLNMSYAQMESALEDGPELAEEYKDETGKDLYLIADFLIYGDDDMDAAYYIYLYNAITGSNMTEQEFNDFIK